MLLHVFIYFLVKILHPPDLALCYIPDSLSAWVAVVGVKQILLFGCLINSLLLRDHLLNDEEWFVGDGGEEQDGAGKLYYFMESQTSWSARPASTCHKCL